MACGVVALLCCVAAGWGVLFVCTAGCTVCWGTVSYTHLKEAAKKAIDDNFSRYSPVPGYPALRNAIVEKLKKENGLE